MSLDVDLYKKVPFTLINGETKYKKKTLWSRNITHNLSVMAIEGNFYKEVWRPEEVGIVHAREMTSILEKAITELKDNAEKYKSLEAENGWGTLPNFISFLEDYLNAAIMHPTAYIECDR